MKRNPFGVAVSCQRVRDMRDAGETAERQRLALQVEHPAGAEVVIASVVRVPDEHQLIAVRVRQWPQECRVDRAEDGCICSNPERERQHRDGGEPRRAALTTERIRKVLCEIGPHA
jgi:hypothetical protein